MGKTCRKNRSSVIESLLSYVVSHKVIYIIDSNEQLETDSTDEVQSARSNSCTFSRIRMLVWWSSHRSTENMLSRHRSESPHSSRRRCRQVLAVSFHRSVNRGRLQIQSLVRNTKRP